MKLKGLILACLMIISSSANASVATTNAVAGAIASANASRRMAQNTNNAIYSVNNALDNSTKVLIPCKPRYIGTFSSRIDRESTLETCEEEKREFEKLNGVRYSFGKAISYDRYNRYYYFELIEE